MASSPANRSTTGTIYLILIQVVSRGLTFAGNQALLRYVSPAHLGLAVQLEALSISVLYTARESLRVALQRNPQTASKESRENSNLNPSQAAVNAAYFVVGLGLLIGSLLSLFYLRSASAELLSTANFKVIFLSYAIATILELLSEPSFVVIQQHALFKDRAFAETTAAISRCLTAVAAAIFMTTRHTPMSAQPFGVGQISYGGSLLVVYALCAKKVSASNHFSLLPRRNATPQMVLSLVPKPLVNLAVAFYGQSIFKWLLTQGDTFVLSYFADLQSQGIFALASNYGGLASRLLFQPIEESSRTYFGRSLSEDGQAAPKLRGQHAQARTNRRRNTLDYLSATVRGYLLIIAIPCTTLLPQIFPIAVQVLLGSKSQFNSDRTSVLLSAYSYYLPFLAINGILDAFVTSIATEAELAEQSFAMAGVTVLYLSAAAAFMTQLGLAEVGLVYANILNMTLRILFSLGFIRAWARQYIPEMKSKAFTEFCSKCLPTKSCLSTWALVLLSTQVQGHVKGLLAHDPNIARLVDIRVARTSLDLFDLTYLATAAVVLGSSIVLSERDFLLNTIEPLVPRRLKSMYEPYLTSKKKE